MSKAARISAPNIVSEKTGAAIPSDTDQLVCVALFSGIGLLISLVAIIFGIQGAWF